MNILSIFCFVHQQKYPKYACTKLFGNGFQKVSYDDDDDNNNYNTNTDDANNNKNKQKYIGSKRDEDGDDLNITENNKVFSNLGVEIDKKKFEQQEQEQEQEQERETTPTVMNLSLNMLLNFHE